jgi:hypothetical protein
VNEGLLRTRFGEIDQKLAGVIPRLMSLESGDYTRFLLNLSRSRGVSEAIGAFGFALCIGQFWQLFMLLQREYMIDRSV